MKKHLKWIVPVIIIIITIIIFFGRCSGNTAQSPFGNTNQMQMRRNTGGGRSYSPAAQDTSTYYSSASRSNDMSDSYSANISGSGMQGGNNAVEQTVNAMERAVNNANVEVNDIQRAAGEAIGISTPSISWWKLVDDYNQNPHYAQEKHLGQTYTVQGMIVEADELIPNQGEWISYIKFETVGATAYMYFSQSYAGEVLNLLDGRQITVTGTVLEFRENSVGIYGCRLGY